jgi:translation initiation factor 1A
MKGSKGGKGRKKARHGDAAGACAVEYANTESGQQYAFVLSAMGDGRFSLLCNDGERRLGILRGSMRRRVWVRRGDVVTVSTRDFQDDKVDILHRHSTEDVNTLMTCRELSTALATAYTCDPGQEDEACGATGGGSGGSGGSGCVAQNLLLVFSTEDGGAVDVDAI